MAISPFDVAPPIVAALDAFQVKKAALLLTVPANSVCGRCGSEFFGFEVKG